MLIKPSFFAWSKGDDDQKIKITIANAGQFDLTDIRIPDGVDYSQLPFKISKVGSEFSGVLLYVLISVVISYSHGKNV